MYAICSCDTLICGVRSKSGSISFHTARGLIAAAAVRRVARSAVEASRAGDIGPDISPDRCGEKWRRGRSIRAILSIFSLDRVSLEIPGKQTRPFSFRSVSHCRPERRFRGCG
jgi:hypothetical protein